MIHSHAKARLLCGLLSAMAVATATVAQPAGRPAPGYTAPRTSFGQPDLQGLWTNATITPFERPAALGGRRAHTPEEAARLEGDVAQRNAAGLAPSSANASVEDLNKPCEVRGFEGVNCGYNSFWVDPGTRLLRLNGEPRTSIVTSTPDGRMPPLTADGQRRAAARLARRTAADAFAGPEIRPLGERCIVSFGSSAGPPMIPLLYNNTYQIVQTPTEVMILVEMVHDVRVVRLNGKHPPAHIRTWMGDSIGRWEGDTLVVETTNLRPEQAFREASGEVKVTERFTRVGRDQVRYAFTIDDPKTFTQSWGGEVAMNATPGPIYEYACHEGNHSLAGILAGAREEERTGLAAARPTSDEEE